MGYRGSKSFLFFFRCHLMQANIPEIIKNVKEQRVDGSYFGFYSKLRCTLMGGESRYQIKIPSNQINTKNFSTFNSSLPINPWFITGLIDAVLFLS